MYKMLVNRFKRLMGESSSSSSFKEHDIVRVISTDYLDYQDHITSGMVGVVVAGEEYKITNDEFIRVHFKDIGKTHPMCSDQLEKVNTL